jgi:hypothetical protein
MVRISLWGGVVFVTHFHMSYAQSRGPGSSWIARVPFRSSVHTQTPQTDSHRLHDCLNLAEIRHNF